MVRTQLKSIGNLALNGISNDIGNFLFSLTKPKLPKPGLYTYRFRPRDGTVRIHLRVEDGGSGVLFVDVTDIIHLNPTATIMAKQALDGVPYSKALSTFLAHYQNGQKSQIIVELKQIYEMIERFSNPGPDCPTCAVEGLENAPLFSVRANSPYKADLALTYGCNNQCSHCYNEADRFEMPSLSKKKWLNVLNKLHEVGVPHIIFTGGEATLHPDLPELINHADNLGMITGLNTNGRRIAHLPFMKTLANAGLNHIQVTLGSSDPNIHDAIMGAKSFSQTVQGIRNAIESNVHPITNTTLMQANMDHVEKIIDFLHALGIRTFAMNGMIYSGGGYSDPNAIPEDELQPLLIRVRDHANQKGMKFLWYTPTEYCRMSPVELEIGAKRCNAGEYSICIEPNGDVLPCQSFYTNAGNILEDSWSDIWRSELFLSFRDRELDPEWAGLPKKCWHCPDLALCGGGCRIEREARDGNNLFAGDHGNCNGCGTNSGLRIETNETTGFIPFASATRNSLRSTGQLSPVIPINSVAFSEMSKEE